jgi:phenylalanine-4-hydroxylase
MNIFFDYQNEQVANLPLHLRKYIVEQEYDKYTSVDHAVWRYVMRQNYSYLKNVAYYPYIPGLKKAGLTIEKIPSLQEINNALAAIEWGAVTVDGFIPPAAFMEFQAYRVLVIAADIRQLEHIEYTSAPDIIHESAGHAPIISDTKYNQYLSYLGKIGTKALFSSKDYELYESIRALSILKEMSNVDKEDLAKAEALVLYNQQNLGTPSEMALLSRLQWWTVEYGLIGDINNFKIYGAGLLSSIGESASCMQPEVKKIPYTIDALKVGYDITKEQPQLFVTPTFQNLIDVLAEFESTMAYRVGGLESILKAIECKNICTATFSSGIQVSGVFSVVQKDQNNKIKYINTSSPTTLCFNDQFLEGHGPDYHKDGFGAPVGQLLGINKKLEDFTRKDLNDFGLVLETTVQLNYENSIQVNGKLIGLTFKGDKLILMTFENCKVTDNEGNTYFEPSWGNYDMAIGDSISSVFNGTADKSIFEDQLYVSTKRTYQQNYTQQNIRYQNLFHQIRSYREENSSNNSLLLLWETLKNDFKEDWLAALEILELAAVDSNKIALVNEIKVYLNAQINVYPRFAKLINDGLKIIDTKLNFE